jgi:hypothetical protein
MAACASCGGCCAHCETTCGAVGGGIFGAMGYPMMGGLGGFDYFSNNHPLQNIDDNVTPVDSDALVDPNHPGHREAIKTISHVDDDTHKSITQRLKDELHRIELGSDPDPQE